MKKPQDILICLLTIHQLMW